MKPIILGQAPSRLGDGRAFTGPSGNTLVQWCGLNHRTQLEKYFELDNLLHTPMPRIEPSHRNIKRTNSFHRAQRVQAAKDFLNRWRAVAYQQMGGWQGVEAFQSDGGRIKVVALGRQVWDTFGHESISTLPRHPDMFAEGDVEELFTLVRFPHPSGLNHQLNDHEFVAEVARRLKAIGRIDESRGRSSRS